MELSKAQFLMAARALVQAESLEEIKTAFAQVTIAAQVVLEVGKLAESDNGNTSTCQYCGVAISIEGSYCSTRCYHEGQQSVSDTIIRRMKDEEQTKRTALRRGR